MIGLQFCIGIGFFRTAYRLIRLGRIPPPNPAAYPGGTGYIPPPVRTSWWKTGGAVVIGSGMIFGAGLELSRLTLPYDPWYEEAQHYRKMAIKQGDKPSAWFGAYKYYDPLSLDSWIEKVGDWIKKVEKRIDDPDHFANVSIELAKDNNVIKPGERGVLGDGSRGLLSKLNNQGKYLEIYNKLRDTNDHRRKHLLEGELKDVVELNKAERIDAILEGKSELVNPEYTKPSIQLGNHRMIDDDDFEMVWLNFEPWDELKLETDYDIRLIPRWAWDDEEEEHSEDAAHPNEVELPSNSKGVETNLYNM
ncbi:MGR1 [[Candida] subhashii]|uniref:MGR1 n=1 Tax=[Candida] subhashii TaxID=561895 RepID=A0A8J5URI4_9ASCO|nr:MGR1 [[Candida] subhashii]KAG7664667.1 MGR1 [[Candida] subhashii]